MSRFVAFLLIVTTACQEPPSQRRDATSNTAYDATSNTAYDVDLLFEHDGCKVYRFYDNGRSRYFITCKDAVTGETTWTENCGKNCEHDVSIPTVKR